MNSDRVLIKFSCGDYVVEGPSPVGAILSNALKAIGARQFVEGKSESGNRFKVNVASGSELLEPIDLDLVAEDADQTVNACNYRLARAGSLEVHMEEKPESENEVDTNDDIVKRIVKDFEALPLEKKMAALAGMELNALGETASFVFNSPYELFGKVGDMLATVGIKKDTADHELRTATSSDNVAVDETETLNDNHVN